MSSHLRPPLKWAGGKFRLLDRILPTLPAGTRLVEPFAGSGVVFLNAQYPTSLLCDSNRDLINFYECLARGKQRFITACASYFTSENNTSESFYALRESFNSLPYKPERAAIFLYLNRHAYNGLVRYNMNGQFNTPFGKYASPYFPRQEMEALLHAFTRSAVKFKVQDFRTTFSQLQPGDVVYCDPPYVALSDTANFTSYTSGTFGPAEQQALAECAREASKRGITAVLSNHDTPLTQSLYAGAEISSFPVQRFISCDGKNRAKAQELLAVFHGVDSTRDSSE